jgi:hypothetical protein
MNFTFGIITDGHSDDRMEMIFDSIESQGIKGYEIIVVGPHEYNRKNVKSIIFDESRKSAWITRKKNLIVKTAQYDNLVFMHDYFILGEKWYQGQLCRGNDFEIRMDKIINTDGSRFRDWCIWPHNGNWMDGVVGRECLIPYNISHLTKFMYISGGYFIVKKNIMLEFPLDERLSWGEGEDVIWSKQVREKYKFSMNPHSEVIITKAGKDRVFEETSKETLNKIIALS